jgi:hypothetical protein
MAEKIEKRWLELDKASYEDAVTKCTWIGLYAPKFEDLPLADESLLRIDVQLVDDALAKLSAVRSLLKMVEECEKCTLKYELEVLLEDIVIQFMCAGLEPESAYASKYREKRGSA